MGVLELRLQHGVAFGLAGFPEVASELVRLANMLGVTTTCKINSGSDMFAVAGEDPIEVLDRWKRWERDRAARELDMARGSLPIPLSPADAAAFRRAVQIVRILRANGHELAADLIARTFGTTT